MRDRVAQNPGRVLVTPESGEPFYATLTRADNPTQEGTPLSKGNLLSDAAAALFGLGEAGTVSDALRLIGRLNSGLGNEWIWEKLKDEFLYSENEQINIRLFYGDVNTWTIKTASSLKGLINNQDESITIDPMSAANWNVFKGKYIYQESTQNNPISNAPYLFIPSDCIFSDGKYSGYNSVTASKIVACYNARTNKISLGYANSTDENAYSATPDADGYYYKKIGQVGGSARIETGTYAGTGKYGSSNKSTLSFGLEPKIVIIVSNRGGQAQHMIAVKDCPMALRVRQGSSTNNNATTWNGATLTWYCTDSAEGQMNMSDGTYHYVAIG